jgi:Na+-driven multidrug efflux pump
MAIATVAAPPLAARTQRLLEAPVASTLLRLAAPNVLVMVLQAVVTTLDAVFVGWLGAAALAGVSLVYPLVMLMQTMSAGGMGGGVASAVARALGAGRRAEAQALAAHAVVIALVMASLFTTGLLLGGPAIYRAIGGTGAALEAAITYSRVVFGGAVVFWLLNTLGSIVRGTGTMALPAAVMSGSAVVYLALARWSWAGAPSLAWAWPAPRSRIWAPSASPCSCCSAISARRGARCGCRSGDCDSVAPTSGRSCGSVPPAR